jgi:type I restriction enzyme S subunit
MANFKQTEIGLIPEDWEVVRLGEVGEIKLGRTPERKEKKYWEEGVIPWVKIQDLNNRIIYDTSEKISNVAFKEIFKEKFVPKGTLLLSFKLTIGKVGILSIDAVHHEGIASLFLKEKKASKEYLFYLFQNIDYDFYLDPYVKGKTLNKEKLNNFPIPLPPLSEQQKIAKVLDKIQQAIEIQDRIIEETKNLKKSLMKKLFTEGLYGEEPKETEIGLIPKSWEVVRLGEVAKLTMGQSPASATYNLKGIGLPFLQGKAEFGELYPNPIKYCSKPLKLAQEGDILISVRAPVGDVNIAQSRYAIGRGLGSIRPISVEKWFLFYFLVFAKNRIEEEGTGSTFKAIRKSNLENFKIPLPPLEQQKQIAHILSIVDKKIKIEQRKKVVLKELFKTMLYKLMKGELRLKEIEI